MSIVESVSLRQSKAHQLTVRENPPPIGLSLNMVIVCFYLVVLQDFGTVRSELTRVVSQGIDCSQSTGASTKKCSRVFTIPQLSNRDEAEKQPL